MSGALPPVPALIPIALLKGPQRPHEAMGEQRPRRPGRQARAIDSARSRGPSAAPPPPQSRKARHRKSDRRRKRVRSRSKHSPRSPPPPPPPPPRVNPIFVWVRQEDTRIVDVKCEDYDKRNRILLTKTAQGWRAIPRTETLPLREAADSRRRRRRRKSRVRQRSAAVQADVEALLPSHKIRVRSPPAERAAPDAPPEAKACHGSPLDNLLAVAEFEFNQWDKPPDDDDDDEKAFITNMEHLNSLIESCAEDDKPPAKGDDCDYTEEDDNNLAMDDILTRLEQSLRSPECPEIAQVLDYETKLEDDIKCFNELDNLFEEAKEEAPKPESSTPGEDEPTDLSLRPNFDDDQPTDLTVRKGGASPPPRPPSQNSEAIQSPQPSGIPAVPPSPDIVSTSANCKNKSVFLESLLTTTSQKIALNSEVTIIKQKEPLDLGKCRKSASPTVTCSEEVKSASEPEPPNKKFKAEDITLKNLLDVETAKSKAAETPRLLELLKTDSGPDPLTQLRQILSDAALNVPDPMLVPKERLSQIISQPGREIPRLLKQRPELRLPEALAFPHLLQDPDILVITLQQLETIILKQNQSLSLKDVKAHVESKVEKAAAKPPEKPPEPKRKEEAAHKPQKGGCNELASDIDAATTAAFNQMIWLPYLNQLEAMSFGGGADVAKMLSGSLPVYQVPELGHVMGGGRLPPPVNFPVQQPPVGYNALEMSMWQEAVMQANMLRPKHHPFDGLNPKNTFRDYLDKLNFAASAKPSGVNKMHNKAGVGGFYGGSGHAPFQGSFMGLHGAYQPKAMPPFGPAYGPKGLAAQQRGHQHPPKQRFDPKAGYPFYQQEKPRHEHHKQKVACKPFASVSHQKVASGEHKEKPNGDFSKQHTQPIDLSGSTAPAAKLKVKQHLIDPVNASKLLKHDDVPEVGSTTASVEEMQDAHKHLWHPLFGNQKGYHSPWNWTTVTATGE